MGRGPTVPGSLGPPAGLVSPAPAEPQPASLAALILPRARRTMARGRWRLRLQRQREQHNQRQPQPPQPLPQGLFWNNSGQGNHAARKFMRFRKKFCRTFFRKWARWAAAARAARQVRQLRPRLRLCLLGAIGPAFRQWRVAFWLWRVAPWRAFHTSLCRVILGRWAAVAREAVRTRAWKARRWAARTRIASRQWTRSAGAFWACFWAWFTAARAGTLFRRGALFWERAEVGAGMRSASWPP